MEAILGHMNVWVFPGEIREVGRRQENICEIRWAEPSLDESEGKTAQWYELSGCFRVEVL